MSPARKFCVQLAAWLDAFGNLSLNLYLTVCITIKGGWKKGYSLKTKIETT